MAIQCAERTNRKPTRNMKTSTGNTMSGRMTDRRKTSPLVRVRRTLLCYTLQPPAYLRPLHKFRGKKNFARLLSDDILTAWTSNVTISKAIFKRGKAVSTYLAERPAAFPHRHGSQPCSIVTTRHVPSGQDGCILPNLAVHYSTGRHGGMVGIYRSKGGPTTSRNTEKN